MLAIFAAVKQEIQGVAKQMKIKNTYRHSDFRIFEGTLNRTRGHSGCDRDGLAKGCLSGGICC